MRAQFSVVLLSAALLGLGACDSILGNPTPLPAGYTYHEDLYKAPPGPAAPDLGYDYSATLNEDILNSWRDAVTDIVDHLEDQTGFNAPGAVYIEPNADGGAFYSTFDDVLREELAARGYTLARTAGAAPQLRYAAVPVVPENGAAPAAIDPNAPQGFTLTLTILDPQVLAVAKKGEEESAILGAVSGTYALPGYGFRAPAQKSGLSAAGPDRQEYNP